MDKNTLLVKTEKGRDAMARRVPELGPRLRSMLIMVDGKRSMSELDKLGAGLGGGAALLEQLLGHGWIAPVDGNATFQNTTPFADSRPFPSAAPPPVVAVDPPVPAAPATLPFADARRLVVRFVNDQVGPMGEQTAIRIESCKTAAELQAQLPRIRDALQNFRGMGTVQRFDQDIVPQLPRS
jgi:hypothetical protein